jgi:hypothetical protein
VNANIARANKIPARLIFNLEEFFNLPTFLGAMAM